MSDYTAEEFVDHFLMQYSIVDAGEPITEVFGAAEQSPIIHTIKHDPQSMSTFFMTAIEVLDKRIDDRPEIEKDKILRCYMSSVTNMLIAQAHGLFEIMDKMYSGMKRDTTTDVMETEGIYNNLDFEMPQFDPDEF